MHNQRATAVSHRAMAQDQDAQDIWSCDLVCSSSSSSRAIKKADAPKHQRGVQAHAKRRSIPLESTQ